MVKKIQKHSKQEPSLQNQKEESKNCVEEKNDKENEVKQGLIVKIKKANDQALKKNVQKMELAVKQNIDMKQVILAIKSLQEYFKQNSESKKQKNKLFANENPFIFLTFTLRQVPSKPSPKPIQINISKPFNSKEYDTRVCVFVKDPEEEFKKQIEDLDIPCIAQIIGYDKLKREFRQFQDKRLLLNDFDVFLADLRIYKMLTECLGKEFYNKKVYPYPLKLHGFESNKDLESQLNTASESAYFIPGNGPNYSVKIGRIKMPEKDVQKNFQTILSQVLGKLTCWDNIEFEKIQSISLKINDQVELPVYSYISKEEALAFLNCS